MVRNLVNPLFEGRLERGDHLGVLPLPSVSRDLRLVFKFFWDFVEFDVGGKTLQSLSELDSKLVEDVLELFPLLFLAESPLVGLQLVD